MVMWGAIWGAVLGLLWPGYNWDMQLVIGAVLGAVAGHTLRNSVRAEWARQAGMAQPPAGKPAQAAAGAVASATTATPVASRATASATATAPPAPTIPPAAPQQPAAVTPVPAAATPLAERFEDEEPDFADTTPGVAPMPVPPARPRPAAAPAEPDFVSQLVGRAWAWLFGGNTVVRMGVQVLFVGLAFLAKYAIENALLPPELRLAGIAAAGIALFAAGFRLRQRPARRGYALTLQGAGVAVLYLTVFAAFRLYQFLPAGAAFAALAAVCAFSTVIALAQNAQAMAFIGFAGAFAAPVLVSTGQGSHVSLFGYYLMLGVAIAAVAWWRAWRPLNLLGFFATYGIATTWGVLAYRPDRFASTEPFLIAFFAVYLVAALLYALRHSQAPKQALDATLVFGNPIAAFGLQAALVREIPFGAAYSALALGAVYLALGWALVRRAQDRAVARWLAECFLALGLGFVTLAVPLALDGRWTSAVWAVEGAAVFWMGRRQGRWLPRAAGLALQAIAALACLGSWHYPPRGGLPFGNADFLGAAMLAAAALALAWWSREPAQAAQPDGGSAAERKFAAFEAGLPAPLFGVALFWWTVGTWSEIARLTVGLDGVAVHWLGEPARSLARLLAFAATAFALHPLAWPTRRRPWAVAAAPALLLLPLMFAVAAHGMATLDHVFQSGGWFVWPLVLLLHGVMLRRLDAGAPAALWTWTHAAGVWLAVLLLGNLLVFAIDRAGLWRTAWASVILLVSGALALLVLSSRRLAAPRWPWDRFARAYRWLAAAPLAVAVAGGALLVALASDGNARPLPYVPLLNPTDLAVALALAACALWRTRLAGSGLAVPPAVTGRETVVLLAAVAFIAVNTVWLRTAHHFAGVPWNAGSLFASFLVQTGFSILWTVLAFALMLAGHRRALRPAWMLGAALLGATVLKMFLVDLSNRGGSERIVAFIAVGLLMLVIGFVAPLPPGRAAAQEARS